MVDNKTLKNLEVADLLKLKSSLYEGTNVQGQRVIVTRQKGCGFEIQTLQKNGWWEIVDYDESGGQEGVTYRKDKH